MADRASLLGDVRAILPPGIGLGSADPTALQPLWPGEVLNDVDPRRRTEFSAGRAAARSAMAALGYPPAAIPVGTDRAPVWPAGLLGSISHSATICLAIVGMADVWSGLGVELVPDTPMDAHDWPAVLRPEEIAGLPPNGGTVAQRVFACKEAAYKAQYGQSRRLFGFDVLRIDLDADLFTATFQTDIPPFAKGHVLRGQTLWTQGHFFALCALPR